jgi:hypothetical protein
MYGIRLSVAALKPYLARRMLIKFKTIHILEIFPNGERGEVQSMTMNELLKFVYSNIPDAEAHKFPEHRDSSLESKEDTKQGSRKDNKPQPGTVGNSQQEYRPKTSW